MVRQPSKGHLMNIAMLISGGVDSSVALALLKQQGYHVTAFYLKIWLEDELSYLGNCPWEEDLSYVRAVCEQLSVPLEIISLQKEYHERVVQYTIAEVKAGHTPNPDMLCNTHIKFGLFLESIGKKFTHIATGHYAQVAHEKRKVYLKQSPDPIKDQTYFLAHVPLKLFSRILFPIGHLQKQEVREFAHTFNLPTKDRKDSQGICFLGKLKFSDFIHHYLGVKEGDIIEFETGALLGTHQGFWYHTIGQRQGLRLAGGPWYVVSKDAAKNLVFVSKTYHAPEKERNTFALHHTNWLIPMEAGRYEWQVKLRHGPITVPASVTVNADLQTAHVQLHERDQGIASGQFAVFYQGDYCLGSGVIDSCNVIHWRSENKD